MNKFNRHFDLNAMRASEPGWWKDLLTLWRPSGCTAGLDGLRLAIRDGYLNFYRMGQSVAEVRFDRERKPYAKIHAKYVLGKEAGDSDEYLKLCGEQVFRDEQVVRKYKGIDDLRAWIANAEEKSGTEKRLVDALVAANENVIDLEMTLPAFGDHTSAVRMDVVMLEKSTGMDGLKVVFWEAKLATDGRVRCSGEIKADERPEVLKQLKSYKDFLLHEDGANQVRVHKAYQEAAKLICDIHGMASKIDKWIQPLGEAIQLAAKSVSSIEVEERARLVVFLRGDASSTSKAAWQRNRDKLLRAGESIREMVIDQECALLSKDCLPCN